MNCHVAPASSLSKTPLEALSFVLILHVFPFAPAATRTYLRLNNRSRIGVGKVSVFQAVPLLSADEATPICPTTLLVGPSYGSPLCRSCTSKVSVGWPRCLHWTSILVAFQV